MRTYLVTLTLAATAYRLSTLIAAIKSNERVSFRRLSLRADPQNTEDILLGGPTVSPILYGDRLKVGDPPLVWESEMNNIGTLDKWLYCNGTAAQMVAVLVEEA
jgi:hypothetical protein